MNINCEPMQEMYIFETTQLLEQLEQLVIDEESTNEFSKSINEVFRIMHTIKGSSAMMSYKNIAELSHAIEDLFYYIRENKPKAVDYNAISDIILSAIDFIRNELSKIENGNKPDGDATEEINVIKGVINTLVVSVNENNRTNQKTQEACNIGIQNSSINISKKNTSNNQKYNALISFKEGCEMENIRAYAIINKLSDFAEIISYCPENLLDDNYNTVEEIRKNGFSILFYSSYDLYFTREKLEETFFIEKLELNIQNNCKDIPTNQNVINDINLDESKPVNKETEINPQDMNNQRSIHSPHNQGIISVKLEKTDRLMDLIGELVIAEAMVSQNPDLAGLKLDNFQKAVRQLSKITNELQDVAMSIRMLSLSSTFNKMHRIVRDMSKKTDKEVRLEIIGEETEVDKKIIDHISDPLMHLVRNAIDHGIEFAKDRLEKGKPEAGTVTLEARNEGSDVIVIVKDDGAGLNKQKILNSAIEHGLIKNDVHLTDNEIFKLIFIPGFSTNNEITEYSGRGVGMDVVTKNIESIGGCVSVDSTQGVGTIITLKIPLTLAIIDGMNVRVGSSRYTIPITSIKESFRPKENEIIYDPDDNEMIMVRGQCYRILRLHEFFGVNTDIIRLDEGILIMVEQNEKILCIFADELLGQQQVVVKALPCYIKNMRKLEGIGGCALLGDGNISLIINVDKLTS